MSRFSFGWSKATTVDGPLHQNDGYSPSQVRISWILKVCIFLLLSRLSGRKLTVIIAGAPKRGNTWSPASSLQESLPPLHHVLIGAFQVLDRHIVGSKHSKEKNGDSHPPLLEMEEMHASLSAEQSTTSYIDFGFGKNRGTFGGINRFAVTSLPNDGNSAEGVGEEANNGKPGRLVKLTLSAVACNPTQNTVATSKWIFDLHEFYANFLFREAVGRVLADC